MPGVYAKKVAAFGYSESPRTDIYGTDGQNIYNNPFANTTMLLHLSNGGIARISENRCVGWRAPETYISQFYGSEGGYEFSVARHSLAKFIPKENNDGVTMTDITPHRVTMTDVTEKLMPKEAYEMIESDYHRAIQEIADGFGFRMASPVQPTERLPKEYEGIHNGHNGTHHFLIDDFCRAYATGKLSPCNIWVIVE